MTKTILLVLLAACSISCHTPESYETIAVHDYFLKVPSHMTKATDLNDQASLQYQNLYKELYIIVMDENKQLVKQSLLFSGLTDADSDAFNGYVKLLSTNLEKAVKMKNKAEKDTVIHSLQAKILKFDGEVDGIKIFYKTAFINGRDNYYHITTWTLQEKKTTHEATMDKMICSFKLRKKKLKK